MEKPVEVMSIFDNEGYTVDRYSVGVLLDDGGYTVACNGRPTHPLGVWSVGEELLNTDDVTEDDKHIGKEIDWSLLPTEVKETIVNYFELDK